MQIYFVLKKKIKQSTIRIIGTRPSLSQLYAQLIESHLCYFLKSDFFKVVPEAWVSIFMGEDTASENHPIALTCNVMQPDLKFLVAQAVLWSLKASIGHQVCSVDPHGLAATVWIGLAAYIAFPAIATSNSCCFSPSAGVPKGSQHGTGCTELKCSQQLSALSSPQGF